MRAHEFLPERTEPFEGLDLEMEFDEDEIWVTARDASGRELGHVLFVDTGDELVPQDLEVEERFRGQGIARVMYDWVKSKGYRIRRSNSQTRAGAEFWNRNRPGENVWENFADGVVLPDRLARPVIRRNQAGEPVVRYLDGNNGEFLVLHDNGKFMKLSPDNKEYLRQKFGLKENFADGRVKGRSRPGRFKRAGVSCKGSVTDLRRKAKNSSGERQKGFHWCANMKSGRQKNK